MSLPGVPFAGQLSAEEKAVWQLTLRALNFEPLRHYWLGNECCEGCVGKFLPLVSRLDSLGRLTRSSLGSDASPVSLVLLAAFTEGIREFREYVRAFDADEVRNTPWGAGSRVDYLDAMHRIRAHLRNVLQQVMRLIGEDAQIPEDLAMNTEWSREAYGSLNIELDQDA